MEYQPNPGNSPAGAPQDRAAQSPPQQNAWYNAPPPGQPGQDPAAYYAGNPAAHPAGGETGAENPASRYARNYARNQRGGQGDPASRYARNYARNQRGGAGRTAQTETFPWWLVALLFFVAPPFGVVLLIVNLAVMAKDRYRSLPDKSPYQPPAKAAQGGAFTAAVRATQNSEGKEKRLFETLLVVGVILTAVGGLATVGSAVDSLWMLPDVAWFLEEVWPPAMLLFGGLGCCYLSHRGRTSWLLRRKISIIVGDADSMYITDIAASLGCEVDKCIDHLENCILKGTFGPNAYLDMRSMALVVRGKAPCPKAAQQPPPKPEPAPAPETAQPAGKTGEESRYDAVLKQLRQINDAIPDEEMSAKIGRLEKVSAKIFAQLQDDPEKLPQLRKFMDYYLPTSLKLLNTYAELEAQDVEGANISESKRRIEQSMDTLVTAFENQLDKLFQDDALDVSTDIEVMEKMLSADGLVGNSDPFGLHGGKQG